MVFLELFHGRKDPSQDMEGWGEDGPIFGPFLSVQMSYRCQVKLIDQQGDMHFLVWEGENKDLVYYDGMYYGDICAFDRGPTDTFEIQLFDVNKTRLRQDN